MENLYLIDTHCHLEDILFDEDRDVVVQQAKERKIAIITSAITEDSWKKGIQIASKYDNVFPSLGLNPTQYQNVDLAIESILENEKELVAIGEIGLDHFLTRDHEERNLQEVAFKKLLGIARDLDLPVQIHSRSAGLSYPV